LAALYAEIRRLLVGVEVIADANDAVVEAAKIFQQIAGALPRRSAVAAGPVLGPIQSPVQRTHHAVIVHRGKAGLPIVHPLCVARGHVYSRNTTTERDWRPESVQRRNSALSSRHSAFSSSFGASP